MGPAAGEGGGRVVAQGTPAEVRRDAASRDGRLSVRSAVDPAPGHPARRRRAAARRRTGRAGEQPDRRRSPRPARRPDRADRRLGLGQVVARARRLLPRPRARARPGRGHARARTTRSWAPISSRDVVLVDQSAVEQVAARQRRDLRRRLGRHPHDLLEDRPMRRRAAMPTAAASRSTCPAAAASGARATGTRRSRCSSSPTSTSRARTATAGASVPRSSRSGGRGSRSRTCSA